MKVVRIWKSTSQYGAEYCWELWALQHLISLVLLRIPFLYCGRKNKISLFFSSQVLQMQAGSWSPPTKSELVLCVVWGFLIMLVLQVETIFPSGRHLRAFVGGISFTQWWICCSEGECCLGVLKSGGCTLELSKGCLCCLRGCPGGRAVLWVNYAAKSSTKMGRSCGRACLNSGCVHVWWDARERKCGGLPGSAEISCVCGSRPSKDLKGELPPVTGGTASGFPLWPPCSAGETTLALKWAPAEESHLLSKCFHPKEVWGNFKHACGTWVFVWLVFGKKDTSLEHLPSKLCFFLVFSALAERWKVW